MRSLQGTIAAAAALFLIIPGFSAQGPWRTAQKVVDGDTVVLDGGETVRLIGIDSPEKGQPFEKLAAEFTRLLTQGKRIRLEYDAERTDKYGRTLAYLHLEDGTFVNAQIVKQGLSRVYDQYPFKYLKQFRDLERQARSNNAGLWVSGAWAVAAPSASVAAAPSPSPKPAAGDVIVYVTKTGTKYHRAGCSSLRRSAIPMPLKEAAAKYSPCSICKPPAP